MLMRLYFDKTYGLTGDRLTEASIFWGKEGVKKISKKSCPRKKTFFSNRTELIFYIIIL
jgi:hypothetical protein